MPFRDSFRRAVKRSDTISTNSSSSSSTTPTPQSGTATPIASLPGTFPPGISRTSTTLSSSNKLSLSKTFTWGRGRSSRATPEEQQRKKIEEWQEHDAKAWDLPPKKPNKHKSKAHQDLLRTFELRFKDVRESWEERRGSVGSKWSGVSPGQSRVGSVSGPVRKSVVQGMGPLSREVSRDDPPLRVVTVLEA